MTKRRSPKKKAAPVASASAPNEGRPEIDELALEEEDRRNDSARIAEMLADWDDLEQEGAEFVAISEKVNALRRDAEAGKPGALHLLHHMAKVSTQALGELPPDSEAIRQIAGHEYLWPILMPDYRKAKPDPRLAYLKELGLARYQPLEPKKFLRTETVARVLVEHAIEILTKLRGPANLSPPARLVQDRRLIDKIGLRECDPHKSLPPLPNVFALGELTSQPDSINRWFAAIKVLVLQQTDGAPTGSKFPQLRGIGIHHQTHGGATPGSKTAEANIRQRFFEQLKKALKEVVMERQPLPPSEGIQAMQAPPAKRRK